ncbi:MAG: hypothetical protein EHM42_10240 [Planctomycetaceae bacterium]|nr:MAG: hypothetical protein EHM42_10240 [Planctomycetaceae bacterium]
MGRERGRVSVVDDQHCTPTSASDLASAITDLLATSQFGLYHATNQGSTTWCGLAREIFRQTGSGVEVIPITSADFGARARRPAYSVLNGTRLARVLGRSLPPWQDALAHYLESSGDVTSG